MSNYKPNNPTMRGGLRLAETAQDDDVVVHKPNIPRQFVNFSFYRARPEWLTLSDAEKERGKREFVESVDAFRRDLLIHTYSLAGLRPNVDFMIWRVGYDLD